MPNPRVTVILTSELVSLLNAELERNPWSEGMTGAIRKPRSMSEVIASAALKGLASNGHTVGSSDDGTVRRSNGRTVTRSDEGGISAYAASESEAALMQVGDWVAWAVMHLRDEPEDEEGELKPPVMLARGDTSLESQEGYRKRLGEALTEGRAWSEWAATRASRGGTGEELRGALDGRLDAMRELARRGLAGYSDKWTDDQVVTEVREALGAERLEESTWLLWARERLGVDASYTAEELRDHLGSELGELRKADLEQKVAVRLASLGLESWLEWARERLGVEGGTSEDLREGLTKALDGTQGVDPRLSAAPEWLTPGRAITCLLDVITNPEAMKKLEAGSRKRHPEWF